VVTEGHQQVPDLLGSPQPVRIRDDALKRQCSPSPIGIFTESLAEGSSCFAVAGNGGEGTDLALRIAAHHLSDGESPASMQDGGLERRLTLDWAGPQVGDVHGGRRHRVVMGLDRGVADQLSGTEHDSAVQRAHRVGD
jgi:hypothetical protein